MRSDMWRLYRHILIGGAIILALCYVVVELLQSYYDRHQVAHLNKLDVELSTQLALHSPSLSRAYETYSRFDWQLKVPTETISNGAIRFDSDSNKTRVYLGHTLFMEGQEKPGHNFYIAALLREFFLLPISVDKKLNFLRSVNDLELKQVEHSDWNSVNSLNAGVVQTDKGKIAFLWRDDSSQKLWQISVSPSVPIFPLSIVVVLIVVAAMIALLILVWIELGRLDRKRAHFEAITRQIARGRGALPQGVVDSSGTLKELAYSFDSMSTHIQRLLKVQREMINAISHELRTPIARLRFGLEAIKDEVGAEMESSVQALEVDVEELNTLVDEVLTYGKLEEGSLTLNFEETNIKQLLNGIVEHNQALLQKLEVYVNVCDDDFVNADVHHLHRALQNLILNASKYANSIISITFTSDAERWQVDIEDDGPGIPVEDRDKVFIPFQRLDNSRTRSSGGYGLGLAIVQRIAFWHGGAVLVDGSKLGGAKFSLIWSRSQHQKSLG